MSFSVSFSSPFPSTGTSHFYSADVQVFGNATSLEMMGDAKKHELAVLIQEGSSNNQFYETAIKIVSDSRQDAKNDFFNDPVVQGQLLSGLMKGDVKDEHILEGLKSCNPSINPERQQQILTYHLSFLIDIVPHFPEAMIACRFFTIPKLQQEIASWIKTGGLSNWANDPEKLVALIRQLPILTDPEAQRSIASAIRAKCFGNHPKVLIALIGQLAMLTDPEAQQTIADAISEQCFGSDAEMLTALVGKFAIFTAHTAQVLIASTIDSGFFGDDLAVLTALGVKLTIFTYPEAQRIIAKNILEGVSSFSNNLTVLRMARKNMDVLFTDPEALAMIKEAEKKEIFDVLPSDSILDGRLKKKSKYG